MNMTHILRVSDKQDYCLCVKHIMVDKGMKQIMKIILLVLIMDMLMIMRID